ncbi:MAG: tail fiber domain-containing protein [Flavobacteriales bacterium]|jgi:hypothetical protein|nr:tail fiber domain-containing protein [Flavobacteriales bacterium]MBK6891941.1 tail fiber domain-containing protein [Flavobacteriales bacterium]MBK7246078.1 tail fiber domain-containing protein [Flavobacteriales bacterium]MBK9060154.1 tail fiber domain-containing protein [Flavobacteriales bacterium]MBK9598805.1 tail fiber domain-containing protein [Flavobacteriales bacterium]
MERAHCSIRRLGWVLAFALLLPLIVSAQNIGINVTGAAADASALLDISTGGLPGNSKRGFLIPRMTTAERTAIPAPAQGLLVYDTSVNEFWYFDGAAWAAVAVAGANPLWSLTGNAGTLSTDFIGTITNSPLELRVGGQRAGFLADGDTRTSFGYRAMTATTGSRNTAFGIQALENVVAGTDNTAVGAFALNTMFANVSNTAVGYQALYQSSGARNTAVGYRALFANTTGADNTAVGLSALRANTTGSRNTSVGCQALENATTSDNTALGYQALQNTTTGASNTAAGARCMANNTTGAQNAAMGYRAMEANTTGQRNSAMGAGASDVNLTGSYNVAFGKDALGESLASYNTGVGMSSGFGITTGAYNTAGGYVTLVAVTTASYNTAVGPINGPAGNYTNTTSVGYAAAPSASNRITLGTVANNNRTGGYGTWQNFSDARFKTDVLHNVPGLDLVLRLRPVTYLLEAEAVDKHLGIWQRLDTMTAFDHIATYRARLAEVSHDRQTGFVAQEVETAAQAVGFDFDGVHHPVDDHDHYTLGYEQFTLPLIVAVQEQHAVINELEGMNAALHLRIDALLKANATNTTGP